MKWVCLVLVLFLPALQAQEPQLDNAAQAAVETFHAKLLEAAQIPSQSEREAILGPQIHVLFDSSGIAAISLGRTWRSLSDEQQQAFTTLLSALIVATYADRFDSFSGQQFVTDAVRDMRSGIVVQTRLVRRSGDSVALDYFLRRGKVFNVVADGVSDLSLRRADYNSIIKNEGYAQLIAHMENKIALARGEE